MRISLTIVLLVFAGYTVCGQHSLPVDDRGIITFSEVVQLNGYPASVLYKNAKAFVKGLSVRSDRTKYYEQEPDSMLVSNKGSYAMSNMYTIGKRTDGIVVFDMTVEVKEGRYRYTITNFVLREFERDRYGKFVPANKRDIPMERPPSGLQKKQWEANLETVEESIQQLILDLKEEMADLPERKGSRKSRKSSDEW